MPAVHDAWSCWLTRRLALAVIERTTDYVASSSNLAQRAPAELRGEMAAFERDAAIAKTAPAMSVTTGTVLNVTADAAELAERLTISQQANGFHFELRGQRDDGAAGLRRAGGAATHVADAARRDRQSRLDSGPGTAASANGGSNRSQTGTPLTIVARSRRRAKIAFGGRTVPTPNAIGTLADMA